jgi:hypothetical protein
MPTADEDDDVDIDMRGEPTNLDPYDDPCAEA